MALRRGRGVVGQPGDQCPAGRAQQRSGRVPQVNENVPLLETSNASQGQVLDRQKLEAAQSGTQSLHDVESSPKASSRANVGQTLSSGNPLDTNSRLRSHLGSRCFTHELLTSREIERNIVRYPNGAALELSVQQLDVLALATTNCIGNVSFGGAPADAPLQGMPGEHDWFDILGHRGSDLSL